MANSINRRDGKVDAMCRVDIVDNIELAGDRHE